MSSASSAPAEKFQPAWIRSAFHGANGPAGGGGGGTINTQRLSVNDENSQIEPSPAILAKNRYGREEVLMLMPKPARTPNGLEKCPIYVPEARGPTVMLQMSETEQRLQMNINSSKAMSSLNATDRTMVAGGGSPNGPNSPQTKSNRNDGWTPVKSTSTWSRGASQSAGGVTTSMLTNGRGGGSMTRSMGRGQQLPTSTAMDDPTSSPYGQKYVPRGRGIALAAGRGASTTAGAGAGLINTRAQGLYDPRDPKDRPRNRGRSTSEDTDPAAAAAATPAADENGYNSRFGRQNSSAWNRDENTSWNQSSDREGSFAEQQQRKHENGGGSSGPMPEWFDDGDEADRKDDSGPGSFDADGSFRKEQLHQQQQQQPPAPRWRPNAAAQQQQQQQHQQEQAESYRYQEQQQRPAPVPATPRVVEYFYLDPTDAEQGPFNREQMYQWYSMNYFTDSLKLRTNEHKEWKTLGELKLLNGAATPFDYKAPVVVAPPAIPAAIPSYGGYNSTTPYASNSIFGNSTGSIWNEMFTPQPQMFTQPAGGVPSSASAFDDKSMMAEKQRYDMQELMRVAQEQKRVAELKELEYKRQQEELRKQYEEEMLRKQMEQLELQKKLEALEAEKNARVAEERRRMEDEMKRTEEKRQKEEAARMAKLRQLEEEKRRLEEEAMIQAAEARRKEEESERKRQADLAAEEHRRQLMKQAEEDAARIRRQQQQQEAVRRVEEERKAAKDAERMFDLEDVWNPRSKPTTPAENIESPWQQAPSKKSSPPQKPKGWGTTTAQAAAPREKTLREIQEEEERQQAAEAREMARLRKEQESTNAAPMQSAMWSNANQRISWAGSSSATANIVGTKAAGKPAWGGAGVDPKPVVSSSINWDGPSLQAANKVAPAPTPAPKKVSAAAPPAPKPAAKKAKPQVIDSFTQWVMKRLKEINGSVDADVLASFLESVENPNEVEDYIQEYLGVSKTAKEFVKEYLQKRSESRKRKDTDKDDLSCASHAGTGTGGTQGKKKKNKGARLVIDGSCLGFRATSDPNRVNQGEIETVGLAPGQKR